MFLLGKFSPCSTFMTMRKKLSKMFDFHRFSTSRAKSSVFSGISFATLFLLILFVDSIICNLSLHMFASGTEDKTKLRLKSTSTTIPLRSIQEKSTDDQSEDQIRLIPPANVTKEERIAWFKKKLPQIEIFKSTKLTQQFDDRVKGFFKHECELQFFMTWISPALNFGRREFFALESLFKVHPEGCLMILSRTMDSRGGYRILKPLVRRGFRVLAVTPDLSFLLKGTPAETWLAEMKSGNKDPGRIPLAQNLSNLVRLAVLYKYGGVYLDMDFIILKDFSGLRNSIGAQSIDRLGNWTRLNNAAMIFDKNHPLLYKFIEDISLTFDGNRWGHNGPYLVSRVVRRVEKIPGYNFTVLPPMAFYPVDWIRIESFFKEPKNEVDSRWVEDKLLQLSKKTYGVHLWNRHSKQLRIEEGSVMGKLISDHCVICKHIYSS